MMRQHVASWLVVLGGAVGLVGCGQAPDSAAPESGQVYRASAEPADSIPVGQAREATQDGEAVVIEGRIGGSRKPFVDGIAAFTIVDPKVPYCAADEGCPTPWDYCCEQGAVKENIAMVKVVDSQGKPLSKDARELLGVEELNTVVVRGKAERDADGNLAVLAEQVFVKE